jgi:hypothetical protein
MLTIAVLSAAAAAQTIPVVSFPLTLDGKQPISCASAFIEPFSNSRPSAWVLGFWTGLNVNGGATVGAKTDTAGMLAEIQLDCSKHPSMDLQSSVLQTWSRLRAEGR